MSFFKYSPDLMSKEKLKDISVGREDIIEDVISKITKSTDSNLSTHILFVGQRGIGKTNTLLRIFHRLNETSNFKTIRLSEEEYSITSISDLFTRILEELHEDFDKKHVIEEGLEIFSKLKKQNKFPILFIDNLQMLFEQMSGELPKLRSILQEQNPFCIVGSALTVFQAISHHDEPFYNFMDVIFLKGLDHIQISEVIKKRFIESGKDDLLEHFSEYEERIKGLQILTGGNPRLIHSLCEILIQKNSLVDLEKNLMELLDQLTPYFQARMETMPVSQRKLVDTLSTEEGPMSPTELAKKVQMKTAIVITQLRRLEDAGVIESVKFRDKKTTKYQVSERLYRIWREMRSPIGLKRISLFINFLKIWYTRKERMNEFKKIEKEFHSDLENSFTDARKSLTNMCYVLETLPDIKILNFGSMIGKFIRIQDFDSAFKEIQKLEKDVERIKTPIIRLGTELSILIAKYFISTSNDHYGSSDKLKKLIIKKFQEIEKNSSKIIKKDKESNWMHEVFHKAGSYFYKIQEYELSQKSYRRALEVVDFNCKSATIEYARVLAIGEKYKEALKYFETIPEDERNSDVSIMRIGCLSSLDRMPEAKSSTLKLIEKDSTAIGRILDIFVHSDMKFFEILLKKYFSELKKLSGEDKKTSLLNGFNESFHWLAHAIDEKDSKSIKQSITIIKSFLSIDMPSDILSALMPILYEFYTKKDVIAELLNQLRILKNIELELSLKPLIIAMDFIQTQDTDILEELHKEVRDLTVKIILAISPGTIIPQKVLDSF